MPKTGGAETRKRIVAQAMRMLHERGFRDLSLQDIIDRCRVSKGVFYFHFKSKQELVEAILDMHAIVAPTVIRACFAYKSWPDGINGWLDNLLGPKDGPPASVMPMGVLGIQMAGGSPALLHGAMWVLKNVERAVIAELESRGFLHGDASRRSATGSALVEGHVLRLLYSRDPRCVADLRRDLLPLATPPAAPGVGRGAFGAPAADSVEPPLAAPQKKAKNSFDTLDERSIIVTADRRKSPVVAQARRQQMVARLADVFWRRGYYSTSLEDISEASSIPKGSLHTYFDNKKDVAVAVLDYYGRAGNALLDRVFAAGSWREAVALLTAAVKFSGLTRYVFGCPLANMGTELVNTDVELAAKAAALLEATERRFERALVAYGVTARKARAMAGTAVALCEGHLVRMIIYGDLDNAEECREDLLALVGR